MAGSVSADASAWSIATGRGRLVAMIAPVHRRYRASAAANVGLAVLPAQRRPRNSARAKSRGMQVVGVVSARGYVRDAAKTS